MTSTLALIPLATTTYTATILPNPTDPSLPYAVLASHTLSFVGATITDPTPLTLGFAGIYHDDTTYKFQTLTAGQGVKTGGIRPVTPTAVATLTGEDLSSILHGGSGGVRTTVLTGSRSASGSGGGMSVSRSESATTTTTTARSTNGGSAGVTSTSAAAVSSATGGAGHAVATGGVLGMVGMVGAVVALL